MLSHHEHDTIYISPPPFLCFGVLRNKLVHMKEDFYGFSLASQPAPARAIIWVKISLFWGASKRIYAQRQRSNSTSNLVSLTSHAVKLESKEMENSLCNTRTIKIQYLERLRQSRAKQLSPHFGSRLHWPLSRRPTWLLFHISRFPIELNLKFNVHT